jgi:ABC-2 type transport system ATP-binding protein
MIEVDGLEKAYGDLTAVQGLSFQVAARRSRRPGGPNGAGKTTTLRCLAGITIPTRAGSGSPGTTWPPSRWRPSRCWRSSPMSPHLFEYLTVEEHLRFVGRLYGVADAPERIPRCSPSWSSTASGGRFRASSPGDAAEAGDRLRLLHDPAVLLFDEPLTGSIRSASGG